MSTALQYTENAMTHHVINRFKMWPAWLQAAIVGALIIFLAGPIVGIVVNVYQGIVERNSTKFVEAGTLALVSIVGGGVGGIGCHLTHRIRQRGYIGQCVGWTVFITAYLFAVMLMMLAGHAVYPKLELPQGTNEPFFLPFVLIFGGAFGVLGGTINYALERKSRRRQARIKENPLLRDPNLNTDSP